MRMAELLPRKKLIEFHGDACPISLFGARMGLAAMKHLGIKEKSPRNFIVITETPACLVDGIQFTTGCTVGSGSIIPKDYGKLGAVFYHKKIDRAIRIILASSLVEEFEEIGKAVIEEMLRGKKFGESQRKRELVQKFIELPDDQLFDIQPVEMAKEIRAPMPEQFLLQRGFIVHRVRCASCNEYVEETKTVVRGGRKLCIPCSGEGLYHSTR